MAKASRRNRKPAALTSAQNDRRLKRALAKNQRDILASHEDNYRHHRRIGWAALGAVYVCFRNDWKFPSWLKRHFEEAFPGLDKAYRAAPAHLPVLLARALGFTRPGRPKSTVDRNEEIAQAVVEARLRVDSWKAAKYEVARHYELSFETVDGAYRAERKRKKVP